LIVVDTNVLVHVLVQSSRTDAARALRTKEPAWRIPGLWRWEFSNVIWLKVRTGGMGRAEAGEILTAARKSYEPLEREVSMEETLGAALEFSVSAYDAAFLALARKLGVRLVTEDQKLRRASGAWGCAIEEYVQ
jgi:predicted nucleic acid-binding protein